MIDTQLRSREATGRLGPVLLLALATCILALSFAASASAQVSFCSFGSGAGQCGTEPQGVAVDPVSGDVYVADRGNNRLDVFDPTGGFLFAFGWGVADGTSEALQKCSTTCFAGIDGSGAGQLHQPRFIATDHNPASPNYRDLYVSEASNHRVQKFDREGSFLSAFGSEGAGNGQFSGASAIAVGPGGTVYVVDTKFVEFKNNENIYANRIEKFDSAGAFTGASALPSSALPNHNSQVDSLAVDSSGDAYLGRGAPQHEIEKYELSEPGATLLANVAASNIHSLAIDSSDHLFAGMVEPQSSGVSARVITEYDSTLAPLSRFGYEEIGQNLLGLAVAMAGDGVYGVEESVNVRLIPFPSPGPLLCCLEVTPGNTKATVEAAINPEGHETSFHVDYVDQKSFEEQGGFEGPATQHTPESASIGSDFTLHQASTEIGCAVPEDPPQPSCLKPDTVYRYRLVATDSTPIASSASGEFKTKLPVEVLETYATEVGTDAALLHTSLNPLGIPTTGFFQYVDDATYRKDVETLGAGHGFDHAAEAPDVSGGHSPIAFGSGEAPKAASAFLYPLAPGTLYHYRILATDPLLTQPFGGPERTFTTFPLAAEPSNACPNQVFRIAASAKLPDCRAYEMVSPVDKGNADIAALQNLLQYFTKLEQSSTDGDRFAYSSSTAFGDAPAGPYTSQYLASRDPGSGWSTRSVSPPRESASINNNPSSFLEAEFKAFSPDLSQSWLLRTAEPPLADCAAAGFLNLYRHDRDGSYEALTTQPPPNETATGYYPELQGMSADGTHAVFRANGKLTKNASSATSQSGRAIYQLYEHVSGKGCGTLRLVSVLPDGKADTSELSSAGSERLTGFTEGYSNAVARAVSADGSRIVWSDINETGFSAGLYVRIDGKETDLIANPARFWTASTDGSKVFYTTTDFQGSPIDLYEYDVDTKAHTLIAKDARGVAEASEDGSRVFFVSTDVLAGEGEAGKRNLYLYEGGASKLVATLGSEDPANLSTGQVAFAVAGPEPNVHGTRATPDGQHLVFITSGNPTGYDNADVADGRPDFELYLYDAPSDKLSCVSCNPSGARPTGRKLKTGGVTSPFFRVAAILNGFETQLYAPRNLSDNGNRLFFTSYEALLPRDTNGKSDVYEWQRAGGDKECRERGADLYVPSASGCISLISSGQGQEDSVFADASPDGHDVFIKTAASLLPQDPGLIDIYDAREGGGFPPPPPPPPNCEAEACQPASSAPNDPTPASAGFKGAGNEKATSCRKGKVRRKGRCISRKAKRHAHKQAKRANHKRGGTR